MEVLSLIYIAEGVMVNEKEILIIVDREAKGEEMLNKKLKNNEISTPINSCGTNLRKSTVVLSNGMAFFSPLSSSEIFAMENFAEEQKKG